jgi:hypothetical protein
MKIIYVLFIAVLFPAFTNAQNKCNCSSDLEALYAAVKKMPSYKNQIRGEAKAQYQKVHDDLKKQSLKTEDSFTCYKILAQLLFPLKDNHLGFWQHPAEEITGEMVVDKTFLAKYRESAEFKNFPKVKVNLDSLTKALESKPFNDVEGIYHYNNYITTGVYRTFKKDSLVGVVLKTNIKNWEPGQLAFTMVENLPNRFNSIGAHLITKNFKLYKQEAFANGILFAGLWKKDPKKVNFAYDVPKEKFLLRQINQKVQYLKLGSFSATNENVAEAAAFHKQIQDSLSSENLIVDLRNNSGGAEKVFNQFYKLIKKFSERKKVYVLINHWTTSAAEQFTIKLGKLKNVKLLGETTNGTIAYGSNYGNTDELACGIYRFYATDMDSSEYLPYESVGIRPDVLLDNGSDWVIQALDIAQLKQ